MVRILLAIALLVLLAGLMTWGIAAYVGAEGIRLGTHGVIAVFLCLVFVPGITFGLMFLVRLSHDRGFDENADSVGRRRERDDPD